MLLDQIPIFADLPNAVQEIIARLLLLVLALLLIIALRFILSWVVVRPLRRIVKKTPNERDDLLFEAILPPLRIFLIAFAIQLIASILGVSGGFSQVVSHFSRSLVIVGLLVLLYRMIDLFAPSSTRLVALTGLRVEDRLLPFFRTSSKLILIMIGIVIMIQEWGYDVSGLVAGIGLGGLALSLAAQDTLANLFGFMAIVGDRPFDVGEYIVTPDVEGVVERVGLRSTRVRRLDQALIAVPNNKLANSAILNWTSLSKRRLDFVLRITYDASSDDLRLLLERIRDMLRVRETVEPDSIVVYFIDFGESGLSILVRAYLKLPDWGQFTAEKEEINLAIMDIVRELGLSVAFPSQSLYIENVSAMLDRASVDVPEEDLSPRQKAVQQHIHQDTPRSTPPVPSQTQPGSETDLPDRSTS